MQAIILAAGEGKRLRPLTLSTPKPLLKVQGIPIAERTLRMLPREIDEVIFVVNYLSEQILDHFGAQFDSRKITYVYQEQMTGTATAVMICRETLAPGSFMVVSGDDLYGEDDLRRLVQHPLAILAREVESPGRFGTCGLAADGSLDYIVEADDTRKVGPPYLVNSGAYMLSHGFFKLKPEKIASGEYGLPQTLALFAGKKKITVVRAKSWRGIGTSEELAAANAELA